jgi:hypothetical protein
MAYDPDDGKDASRASGRVLKPFDLDKFVTWTDAEMALNL